MLACLALTSSGSVPARAAAGAVAWSDQFGTSNTEAVHAVAVAPNGDILVAGQTAGQLPGQNSNGGTDGFLRRYSADGTVQWTKQRGGSFGDGWFGVAAAPDGSVYVSGVRSSSNAVLAKYNPTGSLAWERLDLGKESAQAVAVAPDGSVLVAGYGGGAWVWKYDANGSDLWGGPKQIGGQTGNRAFGVAGDASGDVYVAGFATASVSSQPFAGGNDAILRKLNTAGTHLWTRMFGTAAGDRLHDVKVDAAGDVYVTGGVGGALPGQTWGGQNDVVVRSYAPDGSERWTVQTGTSAAEQGQALSILGGSLLVATDTAGVFPGDTAIGGTDAVGLFLDSVGTAGARVRHGSVADDQALSAAILPGGRFVLAGDARAALPGETHLGASDAYVTMFEHAPALIVDPSSLALGSQRVGTRGVERSVEIRSAGSSALIVGEVSVTGSHAPEFEIMTDTCSGRTLAPDDACDVGVRFAPAALGERAASLRIESNAGTSPTIVPMSGTGVVPAVEVSPGSVGFAVTRVGAQTPPLAVTVRSVGTDTLSVSSVGLGGSDPTHFAANAGACAGASLTPGQECEVLVTFAPTEEGVRTASLTIVTDAGDRTVELNGVGDGRAPVTTITSGPLVIGALGAAVSGGATDDLAGVAEVIVSFVDPTGLREQVTVVADLGCVTATACTWTAAPPGAGIYDVNARSTDAVGNAEAPGATQAVVAV